MDSFLSYQENEVLWILYLIFLWCEFLFDVRQYLIQARQYVRCIISGSHSEELYHQSIWISICDSTLMIWFLRVTSRYYTGPVLSHLYQVMHRNKWKFHKEGKFCCICDTTWYLYMPTNFWKKLLILFARYTTCNIRSLLVNLI